jgi:Ran GTPase-activating protein (RanGAP) involved in mRNA processing and transport
LTELSLSANKIVNEGISCLAGFLDKNSTLKYLDISKNSFSDIGFDVFAAKVWMNKGITYLDISKCKEISDEGSLISLAESIAKNRVLETLNLSMLKVRKPYL